MLSVKQEQLQSKVNSKFEKYSKIGDPEGVFFIAKCLNSGTNLTQSLKTLAQSEIGKKAIEVELTLLLFESMHLVSVADGCIACNTSLANNYSENEEEFREWFVDEFIEFVMSNEIIDIDTITYEIGSDTYLMSPSCIKRKYAGFRNMLVDFGVIALRADARYTILQKLDKYIARPEVRRKVTEKQLFAQLQKKKELGNMGEEWVLEYEKRRITNPALNRRIKRISLIDVSAGFDIVSFETNESTLFDRFIEVKTYKGNEHFHWSHNEIEKANLMGDQYFIYLVDADCLEQEDYEPKIIQDPIRKIGESEGWAKRPDSYLVERVVELNKENLIPLFTNVDNISLPPIIQYPYPKHNLEINADNINIKATNIITETRNEQEIMAAESNDSSMDQNEIIKEAIIYVQHKGEYRGKFLFKRKNQWYGIYRILADKGIVKPNQFKEFGRFIDGLNLSNIRVSLAAKELSKYNKGTLSDRFEKWDRNKAESPLQYDKIKLIAETFKAKIEELHPE